VPSELRRVGQQRGKSPYPAVDDRVIHVDTGFDEQLLDVAVHQALAYVQRIATTITSAGKRNRREPIEAMHTDGRGTRASPFTIA
jgi:hypothetical protein